MLHLRAEVLVYCIGMLVTCRPGNRAEVSSRVVGSAHELPSRLLRKQRLQRHQAPPLHLHLPQFGGHQLNVLKF